MASPLHLVPPDQETKTGLLEELARATAQVEAGEVIGIVLVKIRGDHTFAVNKVGNIRRIEAAGFLAQAQYDLLSFVE